MSIVLIRHGETAFNAQRVMQPPDVQLSERGQRQAQAVARRVAALPIAGILSSDHTRAAQTAQEIAQACALPIEWEDLLQERNYGELRGRRYDALGFDPHAEDYAPPGGESWAVFRARVARAFAVVLAVAARTPGHLAVVSHGLVIREIVRTHVHCEPAVAQPLSVENTSVSLIEPTAPHTLTLLGCTEHLADDAKSSVVSY